MRGQSQRGQQQQRVGEVQSQVERSRRRMVMRHQTQLDEHRAQKRLIEREDEHGDCTRSRQMALRHSGKDPEEESQHADQCRRRW